MTGQGGRRRRVALAGLGLAAVLAAGLPIGLLALDRIFPPDLTRLDGLSRAVVDRDGQRLRAYLSVDGFRRLPVQVESVDPDYLAMLVAFEDKRFWRHYSRVWNRCASTTGSSSRTSGEGPRWTRRPAN